MPRLRSTVKRCVVAAAGIAALFCLGVNSALRASDILKLKRNDLKGNELFIRPAGDFVRTGRPVTYATVVESASRQGQVAVGYRRAGQVTLNPDRRVPVTLGDTDAVIVVAGG